ncbi:MAG: glycosyltransferase family 39 protein [Thermoguttaceae bacterium]
MSPEAPPGPPNAKSSPPSAADTCFWGRIFWCFAALHLVVWLILPVLTQPNAPMDVVEIVYWGHEWQWGYFKHPPLPSWLAEAARVTAGTWGIYFLSQASILTAFWAVWRTAREMVGPRSAFFSVLLLECCPFYNLWTTEFNHGVCMCASWAMAILCFYLALDRGQARYWIATGFCLGLGLLTKYNTATLIPPMLCLMAVDPRARRHWRSPGPYLTMLVAAAVVAPNVCWALAHGCPGATYVMNRTKSQPYLLARVADPLEFLSGQLAILLPALGGVAALAGFRFRLRPLSDRESFHRRFLTAVCLGPVAIYVLISVILHMNLTAAYGAQLWLFAGLLALACLRLKEKPGIWRRCAAWCVGAAIFMVVAAAVRNLAHPYLAHKPSRIHFPGAALADAVDARWKQRFAVPLPVAAGEWWLAGNVNFYSPSRPSVYCGGPYPDSIDLTAAYSDWTNDKDLNRRGGAILWNLDENGGDFPKELEERFPVRQVLDPLTLPYQTGAAIPPLRVGIALVPPGADELGERLASQPRIGAETMK